MHHQQRRGEQKEFRLEIAYFDDQLSKSNAKFELLFDADL